MESYLTISYCPYHIAHIIVPNMIWSFQTGSYIFRISYVVLGKQACEQFTLKRWIPFYVLGGLAGASGINGVIALWMPVENYDDSLLNNFRFFLIMTMILNIFVSLTVSKRIHKPTKSCLGCHTSIFRGQIHC